MEEPVNDSGFPGHDSPTNEPPARAAWEPHHERERIRRRTLLRRLTALLGTGTVAFTLTTWLLLRHAPEPAAPRLATASPDIERRGGAAQDPAPEDSAAVNAALRIARAQLIALNGDDITGAYSYFSPRYRARVPLPLFRKMVLAHRDMFHTEESDVITRSGSEDRVVVDIHVSSDDDEDYVAHYTLVRLRGHWVVDDLRWGFDDDEGHSSA
jgi:hypothetical protein